MAVESPSPSPSPSPSSEAPAWARWLQPVVTTVASSLAVLVILGTAAVYLLDGRWETTAHAQQAATDAAAAVEKVRGDATAAAATATATATAKAEESTKAAEKLEKKLQVVELVVTDLQVAQGRTDARLDWIIDTLNRVAWQQGVRPRAMPAPTP